VHTKKTETLSYSQEITTDSRLFVLPSQASCQEDLVHDNACETQQISSSKHNETSTTVFLRFLDFSKLPTYEEAVTFPSLTEYLTNTPMTEEIRKVLDFARHSPLKEAIVTVCQANTPPYKFFMPKQRKPPDKSEIPSCITRMSH